MDSTIGRRGLLCGMPIGTTAFAMSWRGTRSSVLPGDRDPTIEPRADLLDHEDRDMLLRLRTVP
ncbi:hypothetical protein [Nocardia mangyaensis]|uniref:hypothetical protein n=1 Tax=Nocardia mangyaensis TaxID=2213200 RepID=UPI0026756A30|nr:hypothetical protein [Nocardia mangyaensis]MDO3646101.1 hypothetical protein [Nocardia mangyaensis]